MSATLVEALKHYAPFLVGAGAAIAAFWSQARNFASYLSSFLIVRATHDEPIGRAVAWHLRANYRRVPSGLYVFRSLTLPMRTTSLYRTVPFRMPSTISAYWGPRGVFLFDADKASLTGLRGISKIQDLVSDALDFYEEVTLREDEAPLMVFKVMGSMGDQADQWRRSSGIGEPASPTSQASNGRLPAADGGLNSPDLRIDRSFKYAPDLFNNGSNSDPFRGLFYDKIALDLVADGVRWREHQQWYLDRGIPWRRGWLLHGIGGTGKSSMAKAVARKLHLPIYQYYLTTLNDKEFVHEWEKMAAPCMALFEDFDNVFDGRQPLTEHKSLTFDCILNQIQGVSSINGVLLVVTTNRLDRIDPALGQVDTNGMATRPGRIDRIVEFGKTDRWMRERMAQYILADFPERHAELVARGEDTTPAQFQHMCIEAAFHLIDDSRRAA